jgi:nucleolar protein 12
MDPFEAAQQAVLNCDATVFMEHTLRVDLARPVRDPKAGGDATLGDPKLSVFVGNLDFATKEEDLRVFFEALLSTERGPPPAPDADDEDASQSKRTSWVTKVRVVRDRDTQLGKGFAYVQFLVRSFPCVCPFYL